MSSQWPQLLSGSDTKMSEDAEFQRVKAMTDSDQDRRFLVRNKQFEQQFAAIYYMRLKMLRGAVLEEGKRVIKGDYTFCKYTMDLAKCLGQRTFIIGTLYKDMKLKPAILDEYNEKFRPHEGDHYRSPDDNIALEDEFGRVNLVAGKVLNIPQLVTGVVAGVVCKVGSGDNAGQYVVEQIVWPGLAKQSPYPSIDHPRYVLLMSGLLFGEEKHNPLSTQLVADYITGFLGGVQDQQFASHIERVVIAGNSLYRPVQKTDFEAKDFSTLERNQKNEVAEPLRHLDMFLTQLAANVQVDVMPGPVDPTNYTLPQQPLHPCLFTSARTYETLATHTNPALLSTAGVKILGTAGQNISDMVLYSEGDRLQLLENTLYWRNIAPTAPDSLACYPFQNNDPFVMGDEDLPHIYFAANQPEFGTKMLEGANGEKVRLILVPSFATTSTVVLVNLNDLSTHPITFDTPAIISG